jgi:ATP/maltotriose-dependent transcriptional regulator MalT
LRAGDQALERGRDAFERNDWQAAHDVLAPMAGDPSADPDAIELLAEAAWWLGRLDECIELRERAFARREADGACRRAARVATLLYYDQCWQARRGVAGGWLARARRLLEAESPCAELGFLLVLEAEGAHSEGALSTAAAKADEAVALGQKFGDRDLEADALQCLGRLLIAQGQPAEGLALFDEAMLLASEGKLGLFTVGKVYCSLMSACEELADFQRASEWTQVGVNWATRQPSPVFPGLCRVHRAEMLQQKGDWVEAEAEARRACDELCEVNRFNAGLAYYEIGEIRRRLGDLDAAERAFRLAEDYGHHPQPGLALLRLAQGNRSGASAGIARALAEQEWNRLGRAKLLPAHVEIACVVGHLDVARASARELRGTADEYGTTGLRAAALSAEGRVALAEGDHTRACGVLRRALHEWQTLDLPYEVATVRVLLAEASRAAGDDEGATRSFDAAIAIFGRLGAVADLEATRAVRDPAGAGLPCGLTAREAEVLRLVAAGHSNKDIAQRLSLAQKTVARHVSNIFVKTGVSSRAAATAFAFERGIVGTASH